MLATARHEGVVGGLFPDAEVMLLAQVVQTVPAAASAGDGRCGVRHLIHPSKPEASHPAIVPATNQKISSPQTRAPLHPPQPYWAVQHAKLSSLTPAPRIAALHGLGEHSSAANIHLGLRAPGLCLLYWQRMRSRSPA